MPTRNQLANAIRVLSMDAIEKAGNGHPGAPMGMADIAEVLWNDYLKDNPANPYWADRDRFVLSNGHGSMLIYSLLHLSGYDLPIEELQNFLGRRNLRKKMYIGNKDPRYKQICQLIEDINVNNDIMTLALGIVVCIGYPLC